MRLTPHQAMLIYQRAIARSAGADEGAVWWTEVQAKLEAVIAAPSAGWQPTSSSGGIRSGRT